MGDQIELISGVSFQRLPRIDTVGGSVMHAVKGLDEHLPQFGECYFSTTDRLSPKAWKKHTRMICNLFVPQGAVKFVFYDDRADSPDFGKVVEFEMSSSNYGRLIINPGVWFGFMGVGTTQSSIILNVASIQHDPTESIRLEPGATEIPYNWQN